MNFNHNSGCTLLAWYLLSVSSLSSSYAFTTFSSHSSLATHNTARRLSSVHSTKTSGSRTEDAFSAFAESLDEDDLFNDSSRSSSSSFKSNKDVYAEKTWQESIEQLLDPSTPLAKRQILLSDLLNSNENIREDVLAALRERKVCKEE